uniref:Protein sleepless n=1 Tax=Lutzomyia longipalpis TaxID=7200 RepID=A0A1B0CAT7_LUTLO
MSNKIAICAFVCLSLVISKVFSLNCYTCSTVGVVPCTTVMQCEEYFPELGPNYVCTKLSSGRPNVTSVERGCGRPDACEKMDEYNLQYDVCEICTRNRCNGSVSLRGSFYVISAIVFMSVILSAQNTSILTVLNDLHHGFSNTLRTASIKDD